MKESDPIAKKSQSGKILPSILTMLVGLAVFPLGFFSLFLSAFAFDAPGSGAKILNWVIVIAILAFPVCLGVAVIRSGISLLKKKNEAILRFYFPPIGSLFFLIVLVILGIIWKQ